MDSVVAELGLALAIGLVVGLERGWRQREEPEGSRVAGLRTYGLAGLLGGVSGALTEALATPVVLAVAFIAFAAIFAWFQERGMDVHHRFSVTAIIAGLAVFGFGALAVVGDPVAAGAGGVAVACILASREVLHSFLRRLTWPEVRSALLLLAMTAIVLPLLPNETVDPWGGVNPWQIWFFTVLVATISFAGYVAVRLLGEKRGILVSGTVGAIASSTAVTLAFARRAKSEPATRTLAGGTSLAAMVSAIRVVITMLLIKPEVAGAIAAPALAGAATFGLFGWWLVARDGSSTRVETKLGNPLDVAPLLIFAVAFAIMAGASAAASTYLGADSVILTSGFSGIFDVDVASLSAVRLAGNQITAEIAGQAILLAIALNACTRVGIAAAVGPKHFWPFLGMATASAIVVGAGIALLTGAI
jgi:uncharacterized membrane protein (DUF4010 family)